MRGACVRCKKRSQPTFCHNDLSFDIARNLFETWPHWRTPLTSNKENISNRISSGRPSKWKNDNFWRLDILSVSWRSIIVLWPGGLNWGWGDWTPPTNWTSSSSLSTFLTSFESCRRVSWSSLILLLPSDLLDMVVELESSIPASDLGLFASFSKKISNCFCFCKLRC